MLERQYQLLYWNEYYASYQKADDGAFLRNINNLEKRLAENGKIGKAREAINLIRALYNPASPAPPHSIAPFYIEDYIAIKINIDRNTAQMADFTRLLELEPHFNQFPVYYWYVWKCVSRLDPAASGSFVKVLEKIIALDKNGVYAPLAWTEITNILGYNAHERK